jgi:hypothetical protein
MSSDGFNLTGMPSTKDSVLAHKLGQPYEPEQDPRPAFSIHWPSVIAVAVFVLTMQFTSSDVIFALGFAATVWAMCEFARAVVTCKPFGINQRLVSKDFNRR